MASPRIRLVLAVVVVLPAAVPAAAQDRIVFGGPMRFSSGDIAIRGWFVGTAADVWRVEPSVTSARRPTCERSWPAPTWSGALGRLSLRLGTEIVLHGPAVEPGAHQLVGAGVRVGQRYGAVASIDRAPDFTLMRAGFCRLLRRPRAGILGSQSRGMLKNFAGAGFLTFGDVFFVSPRRSPP